MPRLLFEKTGNAVWISHLDLMRLFQRAFKRANLQLTHTQGFNPRPSVSIALPLSVGVESVCELLDFDLDGESPTCDEICSALNSVLVEGIRVLCVYNECRKIKELSFLHCAVTLKYDCDISTEHRNAIVGLFAQEQLIVPKKGKNGIQEQNIIPMMQRLEVTTGEREIILDTTVHCQNPTLNPMQLVVAINTYLPEYAPSFAKYKRIEIFDSDNNVFR